MRTLRVYLWKESREHRAALIAVGILVPLACLLLVCFAPDWIKSSSHEMVSRVTGGALLLGIALIATELVPGEAQRGKLALLERLPAGLPTAFVGKVAFLALAVGACGSYGYVVADLVSRSRLDANLAPLRETGLYLFAFAALALAFWTLAVSCWLPRGSLTLPAVPLFLAVAALPIVPLVVWSNGVWFLCWDPRPLESHGFLWQQWWWLWPLPGAALVVAWASFVHGRRFGAGNARAFQVGMAALALALAPLYGFAIWRALDWRRVDPFSPVLFSIGNAYLGEGGRLAFLDCCNPGRASVSVIADLETGAWRVAGGPHDEFWRSGVLGGFSSGEAGEHALIVAMNLTWSVPWLEPSAESMGQRPVTLYDGGSGQPVRTAPRDAIEMEAPGLRAERRATTALRLPDGRRVWFFGGELEAEARGGGIERLAWDRKYAPVSAPRGFGFWVRQAQANDWTRHGVYDLVRGKRLEPWALTQLTSADDLVVLPRGWLLRYGKQKGAPWMLLDVESGKAQPALGIAGDEDLGAVLDDGRVLVQQRERDAAGRSRRAGPVRLVEPWSGAACVVTFPDGSAPHGVRDQLTSGESLRTPSGARLLSTDRGWSRFDPEHGTLSPPVGSGLRRVMFGGERWLIGVGDEKRHSFVCRVDLDTGARTILWPKEEKR